MQRGDSSKRKGSASPGLFSDSDDENENAREKRQSDFVNGKVSSSLAKPKPSLGKCIGSVQSIKYGNTYANKNPNKNVEGEFTPPQTSVASKKRGPTSLSGPAATSSNRNLQIMDPPAAPVSKKVRSMDESFNSDFYSDDEYGGRSRVSELVGRLGSEIQQKIRTRKQQIHNQFKGIKNIPNMLLQSRQRHAQERQKLLNTLQSESEKVHTKLEILSQQGRDQFEKHKKSLDVINRGNEELRIAVEKCIKTQEDLFEKFKQDLQKFDEQHAECLADLTRQCEYCLRELHSRLELDIVQSETEALSKIKV